MAVTGHPDFLRASTLVDQPLLIGLELNAVLPKTGPVIDVRRWTSFQLSVQYEAANAGPPASTGLVTLEWAAEAAFVNILYRQTYEINSVLSTDCGRTSITDGMHGPFMRYSLAVGTGPASTTTLVLFGSNRPVDILRAEEGGVTAARGLGTDNHPVLFAETIAVSTIIQRTIRLAPGEVDIVMTLNATAFPGGNIDARIYANAFGVAQVLWRRVTNTPSVVFMDKVRFPYRVLTLHVNNTDAANTHGVFITTTREIL